MTNWWDCMFHRKSHIKVHFENNLDWFFQGYHQITCCCIHFNTDFRPLHIDTDKWLAWDRSQINVLLYSIFKFLYPRHLCRGVYSFRLSVRPFVCLFVRSFVHSFILPSRSWNYFKVLRASNLSGVYLTKHSSESIHIWTVGTLEGRLSFHDSSPQGPCHGVGLEVKI